MPRERTKAKRCDCVRRNGQHAAWCPARPTPKIPPRTKAKRIEAFVLVAAVKFAFYVARLLWKHRRRVVTGVVYGATLAVLAAEWSPVVKQSNPHKEGQS